MNVIPTAYTESVCKSTSQKASAYFWLSCIRCLLLHGENVLARDAEDRMRAEIGAARQPMYFVME